MADTRALAFDTHWAVKALCEAGAAEPRTEAFVETSGDTITGNPATKTQIGGLEAWLYRQLWIMAAGIVGLTVELVKLLG